MKKKEVKAKDLNVIKMNNNKIKEEELKEIQEIMQVSRRIENDILSLSIQKHEALKAFDEASGKLNAVKKKLIENYGDINLNVNDGTFTKKDKEQKDGANS